MCKSLHFSLKLSHFTKSLKHLERDYAWQEDRQDFTQCFNESDVSDSLRVILAMMQAIIYV